jgi:hypothetical protein
MKTYTVKVFDNRTVWYNEKGQFHREDDLPAIEWEDGTKHWYIEGKYHRENGPAIIFHNIKLYFLNGIEMRKEQWEVEVAKLKLPPAVLEAYKLLEANGFKITKE